MSIAPRLFILDVDGVMTTGQFFYSEEGKVMKVFGPDDSDALNLLRKHIEIRFVSGDKRGFEISKRRIVDDMGYQLDLVSPMKRVEWIKAICPLNEAIYMGDGIFDTFAFKKVGYAIAPQNADAAARAAAHYVTQRSGGDRAVAEACLHLLQKFFVAFDPFQNPTPVKKDKAA